MTAVRRWLTGTSAPHRDAVIYALIGAVVALALLDRYGHLPWAGVVGWTLAALLAVYNAYWIVRFVAAVARRRQSRRTR